ncbi:MAG: hypothetical protein ACTSUE_01945 [Promethearchaeota archaeon]
MNENEEVTRDKLLSQFVKNTLSILDNIKKKSLPGEDNTIRDKMVEEWKDLFETFEKSPEYLTNILNEIHEFIFPGKNLNFIRRFAVLYELFYENDLNSGVIAEANRKMIKTFLRDYFGTSTERIIDPEDYSLLGKLVNIFKTQPNLEFSIDLVSKMFETRGKQDYDTTEKKLAPLINSLHLKKARFKKEEDRKIVYYGFNDEILNFLFSKGILGKNDNGGWYVSDFDIFDENLLFMIVYTDMIGRLSTQKKSTVFGFITYFATIFILSILPEINTEVFENPNTKDYFKQVYGEDLENVSILPRSWEIDDFFIKFIDPLLRFIAMDIGGYAWYAILNSIPRYDDLKKQVITRLKNINYEKRGRRVVVKIQIFNTIRASIERVRTTGT